MATSNPSSLIRLAVWVAVGWVIYFSYGCRHSVANRHRKQRMKQQQKAEDSSEEFPAIFSHEYPDEEMVEMQAVAGGGDSSGSSEDLQNDKRV